MASRSLPRGRDSAGRKALAIDTPHPDTQREDQARCKALAHSHYENFWIGSWLLPREARDALAAIYAVVRIADDMADEERDGTSSHERAEDIRNWENELLQAVEGQRASHWALRACAEAIGHHELDIGCFQALFRAFLRDTQEDRYECFEDLLGYCRDSANPVGRLVIQLIAPGMTADTSALEASDALCTGLQLVNHWQDIREDASRGRIYLPRTDRLQFDVDEASLLAGQDSPQLRALVAFEVGRSRALLDRGAELVRKSHGRLRVEAALFRRAGIQACAALERADYNVMAGAPRIGTKDRARIVRGGLYDAWVLRPRTHPRQSSVSVTSSVAPREGR